MKILLTSIHIVLVLSSIHCQNQSKNGNMGKISTVNLQQKKIEKIELTEQTRGSRKIVTFTPTTKTASFNEEVSNSKISSSEWEDIASKAAALDLSKISTYEAPTTGRYSDRAMTATLVITSNGTTYTSASFDSGHPPKELETLYKEISKKNP